MTHYLHYVRRTIAVPDYLDPHHPHYALPVADDDGFERPKRHLCPGRGGLARHVVRGDCIWLFSQLAGPWGALPPALDACIHVRRVRPLAQGVAFDAGPGSRWFPLFDAEDWLRRTPLVAGRAGPVPVLGGAHRHVGQALRLLRAVADPGALERHARAVLAAPLSFISYRLVDGTPAAFELARAELGRRRAVFWDRWSLPRRLAERREFSSPAALDRCVRRAIRAADRVLGVCTPLYADIGSYSRREWSQAERLGKFSAHVP